MLYRNSKLGVFLAHNHPGADSIYRGPEQILTGYQQILTGYESKVVAYEQIPSGEYEQVQTGVDEDENPIYENGAPILMDGPPIYGPDESKPIYQDGEPIYEYGEVQYELVGWQEAWGEPPTEEELEAYTPPPPPDPTPVTDVEILAANIQARLDQRQLERTGIRPDPAGAVPRSRALAAAAMSLGGWGYPSVADLTGDSEVVAILAALYADPTSNTTAESSNTAKGRAVQYVRIMAEGAAFGEEYSDALTAYERTASPGIQAAITADPRDWMALPCGPWENVRAMFLALLK